MPSVLHEVIVQLFRSRGELAPELLRRCQGIHLAHERVEPGSIDLSQVASTEYRADSVVVLQDRDGAAVAAVIVEVQLGIDPDKPYTWPLYVSALRAARRCPVSLLVITTEAGVTRWAGLPIELGHPGFCLRPVVVGFEHVPRIVDLRQARELPELAVLSAMAHPELDVATAAVGAIGALPEDQNRLYLDVILARLPDAVRQALEVRMQGYEYQSEFARRYYRQGREEGMRAAVLALARSKLATLTAEDEAALDGLHDPDALTDLVSALGAARSAEEARGVLDRAIARIG